jgi:NAD(P)-dependent dehydrogenase (short-subunit alcohol dehydrogenase family)
MPKTEEKKQFPPQHQDKFPGRESEMRPKPLVKAEWYKGSGKLSGKAALITGGDSGIGRSVAILFAREGADVAIVYLEEHGDARETKRMVEAEGRRCLLIAGDVSYESFCKEAVRKTAEAFGRLDVLVNNAAFEQSRDDLTQVTREELEKTFRTNIFSYFYMAREALAYMKEGASIINTTSVTAYQGSPELLSYSSTKGAIVSFTRSLSISLAKKGIRVNGVAPGPIWTPLIPAVEDADEIQEFGTNTPMGRAGQPEEVAPCFVFLAARDSSYITGQILHPNGGRVVNA